MSTYKFHINDSKAGHDLESRTLMKMGFGDVLNKRNQTEKCIDTVSMYKKASSSSKLLGAIAGSSVGAIGGAEIAGDYTDSATIKLLSALAGGVGGGVLGNYIADKISDHYGYTEENKPSRLYTSVATGITGGALGYGIDKYVFGGKPASSAVSALLGAGVGSTLGAVLSTSKDKGKDTNSIEGSASTSNNETGINSNNEADSKGYNSLGVGVATAVLGPNAVNTTWRQLKGKNPDLGFNLLRRLYQYVPLRQTWFGNTLEERQLIARAFNESVKAGEIKAADIANDAKKLGVVLTDNGTFAPESISRWRSWMPKGHSVLQSEVGKNVGVIAKHTQQPKTTGNGANTLRRMRRIIKYLFRLK